MHVDDLIDEARSLLYDKYDPSSATSRQYFTNEELAVFVKRSVQKITAKTDYNTKSEYVTISKYAITSISSATQAVMVVPAGNITQFEKGSFVRLVDMAGDFLGYTDKVYTVINVNTGTNAVTINLDSTGLTFTTGNFIPSIIPLTSFTSKELHLIKNVVWLSSTYNMLYRCQKTSWQWNLEANFGMSGDTLLGYYFKNKHFYFQTAPKENNIIQIEGRWSIDFPTDLTTDYPIYDTDAEDISVWWTVAMGYLRYKFNDQYMVAMQNYTEAFNLFVDKYQRLSASDKGIMARTVKPIR